MNEIKIEEIKSEIIFVFSLIFLCMIIFRTPTYYDNNYKLLSWLMVITVTITSLIILYKYVKNSSKKIKEFVYITSLLFIIPFIMLTICKIKDTCMFSYLKDVSPFIFYFLLINSIFLIIKKNEKPELAYYFTASSLPFTALFLSEIIPILVPVILLLIILPLGRIYKKYINIQTKKMYLFSLITYVPIAMFLILAVISAYNTQHVGMAGLVEGLFFLVLITAYTIINFVFMIIKIVYAKTGMFIKFILSLILTCVFIVVPLLIKTKENTFGLQENILALPMTLPLLIINSININKLEDFFVLIIPYILIISPILIFCLIEWIFGLIINKFERVNK